jgi:protein-disulfide isomerase
VLGAEVEINETYVKSGQVKLLMNPMLDHGDRSLQAHQAAECAGEQGQYWPIHDLFYERQDALWIGDVRQALIDLAAMLPLDQTSFQTCLAEQRYADFVQTQDEHRKSLGIRTRPTITINDQTVIGPQPFATFQQLIEAELSQQN